MYTLTFSAELIWCRFNVLIILQCIFSFGNGMSCIFEYSKENFTLNIFLPTFGATNKHKNLQHPVMYFMREQKLEFLSY